MTFHSTGQNKSFLPFVWNPTSWMLRAKLCLGLSCLFLSRSEIIQSSVFGMKAEVLLPYLSKYSSAMDLKTPTTAHQPNI